MTRFGATASLPGRPDIGLLTMNDTARCIVSAVRVPVIADADNGYGNAINVIRTVRAGVAAVHLEDQPAPKRCGHMDGKEVLPAATMAGKIEAAVRARDNPDFIASRGLATAHSSSGTGSGCRHGVEVSRFGAAWRSLSAVARASGSACRETARRQNGAQGRSSTHTTVLPGRTATKSSPK
jgi:hypothetical protein